MFTLLLISRSEHFVFIFMKQTSSHLRIRTGLGTSSHRFLPDDSTKPCVIAGLIFEEVPGFQSSSNGDVVMYALCDAITSITHVEIIGSIADDLYLHEGITDSEVYLREALKTLKHQVISHIAITLEGKRPLFQSRFLEMRKSIASICDIDVSQVGITAITADGLTDCSCGDGLCCMALITTVEDL
jgi:2-C-methyl-D-erythritol 2,4-cyclodiphosphate synthase